MSQATIAAAGAMSTARCYLDPAASGPTCASSPAR
jgi:hypothetical protein